MDRWVGSSWVCERKGVALMEEESGTVRKSDQRLEMCGWIERVRERRRGQDVRRCFEGASQLEAEAAGHMAHH